MSEAAIRGVLELAAFAAARGWVRATSGNFSARASRDVFAITRSGADKTALDTGAVGLVRLDGAPLDAGFVASAEVHLHAALYAASPDVGAIAHTHSVASTVLSRRHAARGALELHGFEMAKALPGHTTHEAVVRLPIADNDQDTARLARAITPRLDRAVPAYLVAGHGLTVWGPDVASARRHLDALEFLLECRLHEEPRP